ncbi:MAG: hypothetical protein DLM69_09085 [Candidatus Chloroheliales bacterium]|nr:MAG: hypothetical protein DLM69_09085 [Chloroflexota bacterium]
MPTLPLYSPLLILLVTALACWGGILVPLLRRWVGWAATLGVAVALLGYVASDGVGVAAHWFAAPNGDVALKLMSDSLNQPFALATLILGGLALLGSIGGEAHGAGFYPFALLLLTGLLGLYLAADLLLAVLGWGVAASASWLLVANSGARAEAQGRAAGATLAGLLLLGGVAYLGRLNGGQLDYAALVPATLVATVPLALLLAGTLVGAAQYPLLWVAGGEARPHWASRALVFGLGLGLPEVYLALRVQQIAARSLSLPDWWFTTLAIVGGLTALLGGCFALRSATAGDAFSALAVAGSGLAFWAISLNTPGATAAALLLAIGLAAGRVTLAVGLAAGQRVTAIVGGLTLALLPPFGGFIGLWLLFNASLLAGNRLGLFLIAGFVLLTLPAAAALVAEARGMAVLPTEGEPLQPPARRLPAIAAPVALLGLAAFSLGLSLDASLLEWMVQPPLAPLAALAAQSQASFNLATMGGQWPTLAVALALGVGLLLWLALAIRARAVPAPPIEAEGMSALDVLAPFDLYLRPLRWLEPRTWAGWLGQAGSFVEGGLAHLDQVLEGRYYILVSALLLLVALLVISR